MSRLYLSSITRYPLKGFSAQPLVQTLLEPGKGLPFDRAWGISNTERPVAAQGAWTACQAFVRLTKNLDLPLFDTAFDDQTLRLTMQHRDGRELAVNLLEPQSISQANEKLAQWFPAKLQTAEQAPALYAAARNTGYWDHEDATLSIIHLRSLQQLGEAAGMPIDAARFRGNLLIDGGAAWEELFWPGHRVRIGDVELEILRPIDRCVATSVNPLTAQKDVNMPALLARHTGHVFCGVYARVIRGGVLRVQDQMELGQARAGVMHAAAQIATAPPVAQWPRAGKVTEIVQESESVRSFWLRDSAVQDGCDVPAQAGQHLRLHAVGNQASQWRSYTVSKRDVAGNFRISIKREPRAGVSSWLHDHLQVGSEVLFSGPFGAFTLPPVIERPLLFLSAGIGITPLSAMFEDAMQRAPAPSVLWIHSARQANELALWSEALALANKHSQAELRLHLTEAPSGASPTLSFQQGMVNWPEISRLVLSRQADVYLCGPSSFMQAGVEHLRQGGVDVQRIHFEQFASPQTEPAALRKPEKAGPFLVQFSRSSLQASWTEPCGSLLDLAEQQGLNLPANCRGGACGACVQRITSGEVMHLIEPSIGLASDQVLMCCTVPSSDLVIDI